LYRGSLVPSLLDKPVLFADFFLFFSFLAFFYVKKGRLLPGAAFPPPPGPVFCHRFSASGGLSSFFLPFLPPPFNPGFSATGGILLGSRLFPFLFQARKARHDSFFSSRKQVTFFPCSKKTPLPRIQHRFFFPFQQRSNSSTKTGVFASFLMQLFFFFSFFYSRGGSFFPFFFGLSWFPFFFYRKGATLFPPLISALLLLAQDRVFFALPVHGRFSGFLCFRD